MKKQKHETLSIFEIMRLVRDARMATNSELILLYSLTLRIDPSKDYSCFPRYEILCGDTGLDEKTLKTAARGLEAKDLIRRVERINRSNLWFVNVSLLQAAAEANRAADKTEEQPASPFQPPIVRERETNITEDPLTGIIIVEPEEHGIEADSVEFRSLREDHAKPSASTASNSEAVTNPPIASSPLLDILMKHLPNHSEFASEVKRAKAAQRLASVDDADLLNALEYTLTAPDNSWRGHISGAGSPSAMVAKRAFDIIAAFQNRPTSLKPKAKEPVSSSGDEPKENSEAQSPRDPFLRERGDPIPATIEEIEAEISAQRREAQRKSGNFFGNGLTRREIELMIAAKEMQKKHKEMAIVA